MSLGASATQKAISSLGAAATSAKADATLDKSRTTIAQNFDSFLSLLTTQLKNQSPLEPLDANQFTQQLVQFASVEQQLKTNDLLFKMGTDTANGAAGGKLNAASAASLIGTNVTADASTSRLTDVGGGNFSATYPVTTQANYSNYEVSIANEKGEEVFRAPWQPGKPGENAYVWNGKRANGIAVDAAQKYTISVVGQLADGSKSKMNTERSGVVTAVDLSMSEEFVQFGDYLLPLSQVKRVAKAI
ncbi:MAG: flagellar hook assembly protein FlgD [Beijerinckiaceae bacterium]